VGNNTGRRAAQLTNIEVLERRRNFLAQQIKADAPQPSAWDKRELEALDWALRLIRTAGEYG
jgi:hypothetical protein